MDDLEEVIRRLKDAKACIESARKNMELGDYRVVVQNAQLGIELPFLRA